MLREIVVDAFLAAAVLIVLASAVGVLVMRGPVAKLHYVAPVSIVGPALVAIAVLAQSGLSTESAQTWLTLAFLLVSSPFLAHATMRAARTRLDGDWRLPRVPGCRRDGDEGD